MDLPIHQSDLEALGSLMLRAGVEPARVEHIVREFLREHAEPQTGSSEELQAICATLISTLERIRTEQRQLLKTADHTLSIFRGEAGVYQRAYTSASRVTNRLLGAVIILQIVIMGIAGAAVIQGCLDHAL